MSETENNIPPKTPENGDAAAILEALLFSCEEPLSAAKLRDVAPELQEIDIKKTVKKLNKSYQKNGRAFHIEIIAGGYQLYTLPNFADYVEKLHAKRMQNRLSAKALETLAIVAYKQPITRLEIEEIRGVNVDGVMKTLLSRNLVTISGTASTPGNPFLYKTTKQFLEYFGLKNIKDLPRLKELDEIVEADSEIKEKFGEEFLKEIAPEILGIKESDKTDEQQEGSEPETTEEPKPETEQSDDVKDDANANEERE